MTKSPPGLPTTKPSFLPASSLPALSLLTLTSIGPLSAAAPPATAGPSTAGPDTVEVKAVNPTPSPRAVETIVLRLADLVRTAPALDAAKAVVADGQGKSVESQLVDMDGDGKPDELVFQSAFAASEQRTFLVHAGDRHPPPPSEFRVYGRFVRERHDDFAWENDRIAHRMYGPDLETWQAEPLTSSGVDVWCKRVRKLVVNEWYMTDDYHRDNGEGADLYSVGKSRGCGGLGVWADGKLYVSRNFVNSRVLANGPIRLVFELDYAPWDIGGGRKVSERKRVIVDAGKSFDRFESTFTQAGAPGALAGAAAPLTVGVGIARHAGGVADFDKRGGWLRSWEPLKDPNGNLGCAVVAAPGAGVPEGKIPEGKIIDSKTIDSDTLMLLDGRAGAVGYYAGFAWDKGGDVANVADFGKMVAAFARDVAAPVRVSLAAIQGAGSAAPASPVSAAPAGAPGAAGERQPGARFCDQLAAHNPLLADKWAYDIGLVLKGCLEVWASDPRRERKIYEYVKRNVDRLIDADGNIRGYKLEDYNLDNINMGKVVFRLLAESTDNAEKDRYRHVLGLLRSQLRTQPRTSDGGFWHKLIYPRQMWLDGVYMASPFLAEYGRLFDEPGAMDEAANQVMLAEKHLRDPHSGLLFHGWDETRQQRWANPKTGASPSFWGRAMGWYAMGVVDVLEQLPKNHAKRPAVLAVLRRLGDAVASVQDKTSGVWWQVLDAPLRGQNFEEASASSMFVYALGKAAKNGWLDAKRFGSVSQRGYRGILTTFVVTDAEGQVTLKNVCKVAGLGGNPYRDGSFDYYTSTEIAPNDPKGVGAFILASVVESSSS